MTQKIEIRVPVALLEAVEKYQNDNMLATRTGAILELIRKGLNK